MIKKANKLMFIRLFVYVVFNDSLFLNQANITYLALRRKKPKPSSDNTPKIPNEPPFFPLL
jgi:hypothetical protein